MIAFKHTPEGTFSKTYEIKYDKAHIQNLAIEVGCVKRAKATGLWATQAHWFVYMKDEMWWIFKTEDLKKYLAENEVHITRGGDNKNALIFLLPEKDAQQLAVNVIIR